MAAILKLRRGTSFTSPQESELFFNQNDNTLLVGITGSSYITLAKVNDDNNGSFSITGDITASNARLSGDIVIGGNIYLGDTLANDNISVNASFSGSLIPSASNEYDLGSSTKKWKNLWAVSASIDNLTVGGSGILSSSVTNFTDYSESVDLRLDNSELTGSNHRPRIVDLESTGSDHETRIDVIETTFSSSVDSRLDYLEGDFSSSVDNRLDLLETDTGSQDFRLDRLEEATASLDSRLDNVELTTESFDSRLNNLEIISESHDGRLDNIELTTASFDNRITDLESTGSDHEARISKSEATGSDHENRIDIIETTFSSSVDSRLDALETDTGSQDFRLDRLEEATASLDSRLDNVETTTASFDDRITDLESTGSNHESRIDDIETTFSSSVDSRLDYLEGDFSSSVDSRLDYLEGDFSSSVDNQLNGLYSYTSSLKNSISVSGQDLVVYGDLTVQGTTTTLNTTELLIEDKLLSLASGSTNSAEADGAGLHISGADASMVWDDTNSNMVFNTKVSSSVGFKGDGSELSGVTAADVDFNNITNKPTLVSGSDQISFTEIVNKPTLVSGSQQVIDLLPTGVISGSSQITITESQISDLSHTDISSLNTFTSSIQSEVDSLTAATSSYESIGSGIVSSSAQVTELLPSGVISGSSQITITESQISDLSHYTDSDVKTKLDSEGVLSGSLVEQLPSGTVSGSAQTIANLPSGVVSGSAQTIANLPTGVISGSEQVDYNEISNVPQNIISASSFSSNGQGEITASVNETSTSFDLGLTTSDSPTFASMSLSTLSNFNTSVFDAVFKNGSGTLGYRTLGNAAFYSVSSSIGDDPNSVPTNKAVSDALIAAGAGDITAVNDSSLYSSTTTGLIHTGNGTNIGGVYGIQGNIVIAIDTGSNHFVDGVNGVVQLGDGIVSGSDQLTSSLDSRYVNLTGNETIGGDKTFSDNVIISGDLTVNGSTTTTNTNQLNVGDNIIELNYGGSATEGGIFVKDASGVSTISGSLLWDSVIDSWKAGVSGSEFKVVTDADDVHSGSYLGTATTSDLDEGSNKYYTDERVKTKLDAEGVLSGSIDLSQIHAFTSSAELRLDSIESYTSSADLRLDYLEGDFSSSLDTRLDALETDTGSQDGRLDSLESFTSSIDTTIKTKLDTDSVLSGSIEFLLPSGVISGSEQVVDSLLNQDVDFGTGDIIVTDITGSKIDVNDGYGSIYIGTHVGRKLTTSAQAGNNTAVGTDAFGGVSSNVRTGQSNTSFGYQSLYNFDGGNSNTAIGAEALKSQTIVSGNTAVGAYAGQNVLWGAGNTILGNTAASTLTTGEYNTILGASADVQNADDDNSIVIGYNADGNGSNTVVIGNNNIVSTTLKGEVTASGHLVPSTTEIYDLGAETQMWRDAYLSGSININGALIFKNDSGNIEFTDATTGTVQSLNAVVSFDNISNKPTLISGSSQVSLINTDSGSFTTDMVGEGSNLYYTDTRVKTKLDAEGVLSGSDQALDILTSVNSFTSSIDGKFSTLSTYTSSVDNSINSLNAVSHSHSNKSNLDTINQDLSTTDDVQFGSFHTSGTGSIGTNLVVYGDLTVLGTETIINTTNLAIEDNMIYLNSGSSVTNPDLGWAGNYNDGSYAHAGMFRDASDGRFKVYDGYTPEPEGTIDTSHASFNLGDFQADNVYTTYIHGDGSNLTNLPASQITLGGDVTGNANSNTVGKIQGVSITSDEATQLANIDTTTISTTQWGYLGALNQGLTTTSTVQFGKVGVGGASDATYELKVTGDIGATGDIVGYISSDRRLKDEITPISNSLEKINQIGGYSFVWNENQNIYKGKDYGVIAQEIEEILPELVETRENGYKAVKYDRIVSLLIEGIKELSQEVKELKEKIK